MFWRWTLVVGLLVAAAWSGKMTLYLWWAGGAPPTPYASWYHSWGNVYFALTSTMLLLAVWLSVRNVRTWRKRARR
jgi:membrane protein implicated in regulation of membrane protease activity